MINRRTMEYEYKMISSFYDNYIKRHNYLIIKSIVLGCGMQDNNEYQDIHCYHVFLINMLIMKKDCIASSFEKCYRFSFDKTIDENICDKVKHILENKDLDDAQKSLRLLELSSNEDDRCLSFSLFVL